MLPSFPASKPFINYELSAISWRGSALAFNLFIPINLINYSTQSTQ